MRRISESLQLKEVQAGKNAAFASVERNRRLLDRENLEEERSKRMHEMCTKNTVKCVRIKQVL